MSGPLPLVLAFWFAVAAFAAGFLVSLWRTVRGPSMADRILGLDTVTIHAAGLILLQGIAQRSAIAFEAAVLVALLGFVSTIAYAKFVLRGDVIE